MSNIYKPVDKEIRTTLKSTQDRANYCITECYRKSLALSGSDKEHTDFCCEAQNLSSNLICAIKSYKEGSGMIWTGNDRSFLILAEDAPNAKLDYLGYITKNLFFDMHLIEPTYSPSAACSYYFEIFDYKRTDSCIK